MSKIALLDADAIAYIVGFASQRPIHYFKVNGKFMRSKAGMSKRDIIIRHPDADIEWIKKEIDADDEMLARHKLKLVMQRILSKCETNKYEAFLTKPKDETQFRNKIAVTLGYKDNRKNTEKPVHHEMIRKTLEKRYGATIVNYYEADDVLAMRHTELGDKSILCTIDKDLKQVPGMFYDIKQDNFINIRQYDADLQLCKQWIMGDTTDNIPGLPGYGEKRALQFLDKGIEYPKDKEKELMNKEVLKSHGKNLFSWVNLIRSIYEEDRFWEIGNLVFMIRKRGQSLKRWLEERDVKI